MEINSNTAIIKQDNLRAIVALRRARQAADKQIRKMQDEILQLLLNEATVEPGFRVAEIRTRKYSGRQELRVW